MTVAYMKPERPKPYRIEKTIDGRYMVLVDGVQWGSGPRDKSGCSEQTWSTRKAAKEAIESEDCQSTTDQ